jgi:hypothetical protein
VVITNSEDKPEKNTCTSVVLRITSPRKELFLAKAVTKLNDFSKVVVRQTLLQFYDNGVYPTWKNVGQTLKEKLYYTGFSRSTGRILESLGFKHRKCSNGRKILLQQLDLVAAWNVFLQKMHCLSRSYQWNVGKSVILRKSCGKTQLGMVAWKSWQDEDLNWLSATPDQ